MNFAFISRHQPTAEQVALAAEQGITLYAVGDADAFTVGNSFIHQKAVDLDTYFEGVIVVHPAAALRLCSEFIVGIFENTSRAEPGKPLQFIAGALHLFDLRE